MKFIPSEDFPEITIVAPIVHKDQRGSFFEMYQREKFLQYGISRTFVQDNVSFSKKGTLRGLHYQLGRPQSKLVAVIFGEVFDVSVDIRKGSPTFGQWSGITLSSENNTQVFIPEGFAHGYCVLSDLAHVIYKCTDYYTTREERGILWNDPSLKIEWPVKDPILSDKDKEYLPLSGIDESQLPVYE